MFKLIDAHTHLQFPQFDKDRESVIERALENRIGMINVGADKESSRRAVNLAKKYKGKMWATVGCHPYGIEKDFAGEDDYDFFKKLAKEPEAVAVGECGLDYYRMSGEGGNNKIIQENIFVRHIQLAKETNKPLMIHCREAFDDLAKILDNELGASNGIPGILHFFTGSLSDAEKLLKKGFYFTFGGLITFNRGFDDIVRYIPLERILLETDAPFVAPVPHRGERNEPLYLEETAKKMAEIRGVSLERICRQIAENAQKVFNLTI